MEEKQSSGSSIGKNLLRDRVTEVFRSNELGSLQAVRHKAALRPPSSTERVTASRLMLEGIHFNLIYTPLKHLGYKAVISCIARIFAALARPEQMLLHLGISRKFTYPRLEEFFEGVYKACELYGVELAHTDIDTSLTGLSIGITATGSAIGEKAVTVSGSREHEIICVSGNLGAAYLGLEVLERERKLYESDPEIRPDLGDNTYILSRQLMPMVKASLPEKLLLQEALPSSMTLIEDGLASELITLCRSSKVGCRLYSDRLPLAEETARAAQELEIDPLVPMLNGGEDYEFLFTMDARSKQVIEEMEEVTIAGFLTEEKEGMYVEGKDGGLIPLTAPAWHEEKDAGATP